MQMLIVLNTNSVGMCKIMLKTMKAEALSIAIVKDNR